MTELWQILRLIWRARRAEMSRALTLTVAVMLAGLALLALSGWFIVAAGIAGLAGTGAVFDVFRPSAGIRFLAMARTAGRYGERLLSHDATLKVLASLRVTLLSGLSQAGYSTLVRLRGGKALNRLTADVDALDGVAIRLVFPVLAGLLAALASFAALWMLVAPVVALWAIGSYVAGTAIAFTWGGRSAAPVAALAEDLHQDLRAGVIDHLRGRVLLATMGHLPESRQALLQLDQQARDTAMRQSRVEWRVAALLQGVAALSLAGTILIAGRLAVEAQIGAAQAALAIFAALALTELGGAMQRGIAELGRMRSAARRIVPALHPQPEQLPAQTSLQVAGGGLQLKHVSVRPMPGAAPVIRQLTLSVAPGETVALTGPSGSGKTTLLNAISGLLPLDGGQICRGGRLGYLPQRPALMAGSLRDALHFAAPDSDDHDKDAVLAVCALPIALDYQLGEGGSGLSGGEYRRLALARVLIQRPDILLLDEPTEGLDPATAERVLRGLRDWLPDCAILIAAHRPAEKRLADRIISL